MKTNSFNSTLTQITEHCREHSQFAGTRALICTLLLLGPFHAFAASETIATFGPPAGPPLDSANFSTSFELFDNGLYWWQGYGVCGELPNNCEIGFKGFASAATLPTRPVFTCTNVIEGATRDNVSLYYAANRRLYTKALWSSPNDPAQEIVTQYTPPASGWDLGAMMLWNGRIYWTDYNGSSFRIRSANTDGSNAQHIRLGTGGKVLKIVGYSYRVSTFVYKDAIFVLTADGELTRCDLSPANNVVLATGVTDFDIREEVAPVFPNGFTAYTAVFITQGQKYNVNESTPSGTLSFVNAASGVTTLIYTAPNQNQITAVAVDTNNVYWTAQPVVCPPLFTCSLGDYSLYRQSRPADHSQSPGTVDLIGLPGGDAGVNLRSDNQWIYFLNGTSIKRLPTDAPAVTLDVQADGLEVTQAIQDWNSDVPLVANRPTYVRGYAHLSNNTTGKNTWFSTALLHGFRNGQEFPDSPIYPVKSVSLLNFNPTRSELRGDATHSFLFELPATWVQSGGLIPAQLTFTMTANPDLAVPETPASPLANNTVSLNQPATLIRGLNPCIITVPLLCKGPIYYTYMQGFYQIMQRAYSLLPAEAFDLHAFLVTDPLGDWNHPYELGSNIGNTAKDDADHALGKLENLDLWSDPCKNGDAHHLGMVHPNAGGPNGFNGVSWYHSPALIARMVSGVFRGRTFGGGVIIAHESGHNYGRQHIDCGNPPPDQGIDPTPYPCTLGNTANVNSPTTTFGYDPMTDTAIAPTAAADTMSYGGVRWVSAVTWDALLGFPLGPAGQVVGKPQPPPPVSRLNAGLVLLVNGRIDVVPQLILPAPFYLVDEATAPASQVANSRAEAAAASRQPDPYFVQLLDQNGSLLASVALAVRESHEENLVADEKLNFGQYIDFATGTRTIRFTHGTNVLAERFISPQPPILSLGVPVIDVVSNTLHLTWTASDADGDPLTFTVQYSPDNGATWQALRTDYSNLEITLSTSLLPGGSQARLRVIASDGVNTALAVSDPFVIAKHPPQPAIDGVTEGQRLDFGSDVRLIGVALDAENGSKDNQLTWTLSGPTPLSRSGETLSLGLLSPGAYAATLSAVDLDHMSNQTVRNFEILPPLIPDGAKPDLDGIGNDDGYEQALFVPIPLEDGSMASVRAFHSLDTLYLSFSNLKFGNGTARSVGLRVDPMGMGGSPNPTDFGFFVDENGVPREEQGDGANMTTILSPQPGFSASIYRTANSWSAEFAISDGPLMGWGHPAAIMFEHGQSHWPPLAGANQPSSWAPTILGTNAPSGPNRAPIANAGPNQSLSLNSTQTIYLDGSGSFDPDGASLSYAWTQVGGPSVSLANTTTATPSFTASPVINTTNLTFQLVVNDGDLNSAPSTTQITLRPPLAQFPVTPLAGGATLRKDGFLQVRLIGQPERQYQILSSTDLVSWQVLRNVYSDYAGRIEFETFVDISAYPQRFFRAFSPN